MNIHRSLRIVGIFVLIFISSFITNSCTKSGTTKVADLENGFLNPPDEAKPRVWWHWMNGNITKEGVRKDLEWMHRVGIGGFQNFDAAFMTPQVVKNRLQYMTPEWKDAFEFTTKLADSLGLEMAIAGSPGWSESGGPWVKPAQGMKKYVWSKIIVKGGQPFRGELPQPPATTGPFQDLPFEGGIAALTGEVQTPPEYYQDVAVVAFRLPDTDTPLPDLQPEVTSSGGDFNLAMLTDGDLATTSQLPAAPVGDIAWVQYEFSEPETFQSLTIVGGDGSGGILGSAQNNRTLQVSDDGVNYHTAVEIPGGGVGETTLTFEPVTGRYFRFTFRTPPPQPDIRAMLGFGDSEQPSAPSGIPIAELVLHSGARVNRFEDKAAFTTAANLYDMATPSLPESDVIAQDDVVDLTSQMDEDGTLTWEPPAGNWMVLRLGFSLLGITNHPATAEATGLEVDKLNADHVRSYFTQYLDIYKDATGGLMGQQGLRYIITDSWEAGAQNWTDGMLAKFRERRGYSMIPWLPVLSGHVVESAEASDRFLWDFRRTIADLIALNHYDLLTKILEQRHMGRYSESHESGRAIIADGMEVKKTAQIPMSAMWVPGGFFGRNEVSTGNKADVRESASVAHVYGQKYVAAESMTSAGRLWAWSPQTLKPTADMELAHGLNRFVIHTSVHQPLDDYVPGFTLGPFGQTFNRHETWAEQAKPWIQYLTRSSFMLQQGDFVADVAYFYGQGSNITALFGNALPPVPESFNYDFINADALVNELSVKDGNIVSASGMNYKVLALDPNSRYMTLPVLRKIRDLAEDGAVVIGDKPIGTPSLSDDEDDFQSLADELWVNENGVNTVGRGKIYAGHSIGDVLTTIGISPDFTYTKPRNDTHLLFVHRKAGGTDIYWVNNRHNRVENLGATFRVAGREAEIWNPVTGTIEPASYSMDEGLTTVPLHLEPSGAVFVVFRNPSEVTSRTVTKPTERTLATLRGPWEISFQANRGAPAQVTFQSLIPWNEHSSDGIKYFSGTGTYTKTIQVSPDWFQDSAQVWIDLGDVRSLAEVVVNGELLGSVWKKPFRINMTNALQESANTLEIKVTNLWVNRLIGDQQPGASTTFTSTSWPYYHADSPLMRSGLLGPVQMIRLTKN